jgi:tRNA1(Val) A37 N6-methylase TrmN6
MQAYEHTDVKAAREAFPRGLAQPEGGFRFGSDALLLAAFATRLAAGPRTADLGTGCGAAGLGYLLTAADAAATVVGLDRDPAMIRAATQNAAALGLADRFTARDADLRDVRQDPRAAPESCDLVICNPPYRHPASGRRPPGPARDAARFEVDGDMADFAAAGAYLLANKGVFACIHLAERLPRVFAALAGCRLEVKSVLPIAPREAAPARQVLVAARKNGGPGMVLEPPLILYAGTGAHTRLTGAALAFCPFLACNAAPCGGA